MAYCCRGCQCSWTFKAALELTKLNSNNDNAPKHRVCVCNDEGCSRRIFIDSTGSMTEKEDTQLREGGDRIGTLEQFRAFLKFLTNPSFV